MNSLLGMSINANYPWDGPGVAVLLQNRIQKKMPGSVGVDSSLRLVRIGSYPLGRKLRASRDLRLVYDEAACGQQRDDRYNANNR